MSITIDDGSPRLETGGQGHRDRPAAARQLPASQQPARSLRQQPGALWEVSITDRLIRTTTALAVATVAAVAAVISYRHAYELARTHGETGAPIARPPGPVSRSLPTRQCRSQQAAVIRKHSHYGPPSPGTAAPSGTSRLNAPVMLPLKRASQSLYC